MVFSSQSNDAIITYGIRVLRTTPHSKEDVLASDERRREHEFKSANKGMCKHLKCNFQFIIFLFENNS